MTTTSATHSAAKHAAWRDRIAAILMILASVGAVFAFFGGISATRDAEGDRQLVEMWRMYGMLVFAALFLLLALRPRSYRGIWEVAFFHKAAVAVTALFMRGNDTESAGEIALIDGLLATLIAGAYILSRGYVAWRELPRQAGETTGA